MNHGKYVLIHGTDVKPDVQARLQDDLHHRPQFLLLRLLHILHILYCNYVICIFGLKIRTMCDYQTFLTVKMIDMEDDCVMKKKIKKSIQCYLVDSQLRISPSHGLETQCLAQH